MQLIEHDSLLPRLMDTPIFIKNWTGYQDSLPTIEIHALFMIGTIYHVENWLGWVSFNPGVCCISMIGTLYQSIAKLGCINILVNCIEKDSLRPI